MSVKEPEYIYQCGEEQIEIKKEDRKLFEQEIENGILSKPGKYLLVLNDDKRNTYFVNEDTEYVDDIKKAYLFKTSSEAFEAAKIIAQKYPEQEGKLKIINLEE